MPAIYLLDANGINDAMSESPQFQAWLGSLPTGTRLITCTIVWGEVLFGIARLAEGKRRTRLNEKARFVFRMLSCEPVPERAAEHCAEIKLTRQRKGLAIGENDLWIAATALALDAILVSRDRDFNDIKGLTVLAL